MPRIREYFDRLALNGRRGPGAFRSKGHGDGAPGESAHATNRNPSGSPSPGRLLLAFAVVPLFDALAAYVGYPVWFPTAREFADRSVPARQMANVAGAFGLLVTVCAGFPVVYALRRHGALNLRNLTVAGLLLGNVPFGIYLVFVAAATAARLADGTLSQRLVPFSELAVATLRVVAFGSTIGAASAVVFWVLGVVGADDRH